MILCPTVWSLHFLFCYILAAVFCAKAEGIHTGLDPVRLWIAGVTVVALILIAFAGLLAYRQWGPDVAAPPHDADTIDDRRRFFGLATLLLAGLSFVGVLFVALPALMIGTCR
jgi:hypothetical protein